MQRCRITAVWGSCQGSAPSIGKLKSFPKDDASKKPHLTAFRSYKAGMTHIVRHMDRPGSKPHKGEIAEGVSVLDAPPMVAVAFVDVSKLRAASRRSRASGHLSEECKRRFYKT